MRVLYLYLVVAFCGYNSVYCQSVSQSTLDYIAANLGIRYDVLDNFQDSWRSYKVQLTLSNAGSQAIANGDWSIYLCHIRVIEPVHTKHNPDGYVLPGYGLKVTHVNGCQHRIQPTADFKPLLPGDSRPVLFNAENWAVAKTDVMPNFYVAAEGLQARTITSTSGESLDFVGPFDNKFKWKRFDPDKYNPFTPEERFAKNNVTDLKRPGLLVLPSPSEVTGYDPHQQVNLLTGDWEVIAGDELKNEAAFLADKLGIRAVSFSQFRQIKLQLGDVAVGNLGNPSKEAYSLEVDAAAERILITGVTPLAVFWGVQSLLSLGHSGYVPKVTIRDAPRFEYRGMEIDLGRNFMPKSEILKLIDAMSMYKLNKLHLHLTDDEGWRLEIPGLPELTTLGSKRCHDPREHDCIDSQLGSGPGTGNSGTGYYTVSEYRDILRYARDRHVEVIPEFDMPGHGHAAIKAMQSRYRKYLAKGDKYKANQYILSDPLDKSEYLSVQFFTDNAINPCLESTYEFIEHIVFQVRRMHFDVQPLTTFHFGGDEVAHGAWTKSPACAALAQKLGLNFTSPSIVKDLKEYFVRRVSKITSKYCLDLGSWEDGVLGVKDKPYDRGYLPNRNVYAYAWDNVWEWGHGSRAYKLANAGYKVVMTQATHLYFDHPYEPDPEERGYYWAPRYIDTRKTFGFMPDNLYANADFTRMGDPIVDLCQTMYKGQCVPLKEPNNIAGMAGALWSETVRTPSQLQSMIYPRLLALAERAWHNACWEIESDVTERSRLQVMDWEMFANALGYKELLRLDQMRIDYHIPVPGAVVKNGVLMTDVAFPGLVVQYSVDNGKTWSDVTSAGIRVSGEIVLATRSADRRRLSRRIKIKV
ncbi:beta-hexosaminidase [Nematostella vectensis]|uniref:beta-hexosaminidase n=1 Tax=Nematostella vectensis TaxID=45351 RepID=UPI0020770D75|nr:beta-hexosaminidase [Nematostella vectensis]